MLSRIRAEPRQKKTKVFKKWFKKDESLGHALESGLPEILVRRPKSRQKERDTADSAPRTPEAVRKLLDSCKVNFLAETDDDIRSAVVRLDEKEKEEGDASTNPSPIQQSDPHIVLPKTEAKSNPEVTVSATSVLKSQELWDAAFVSIEKTPEGKELAQKYFKILHKILGDEDDSDGIDSPVDDSIEAGPRMATLRQRNMVRLVQAGLKKVEKSAKITNKMGALADAVLAARPLAEFIIQTVPQAAPAALPWAGVCVALQLLSKPAKANKVNLEGVKYVILRMEWYCALTDLLINPWNIEANGRPIEAILNTLRERVVDLYRKLLLFLMESVCTYNRHQGLVFVKNATELSNKWNSSLTQIKEDEANLRIDSEQFNNVEGRRVLQETSDRSTMLLDLVGNLDKTVRDFQDELRHMQTSEDDRFLLRQLFVVDPKDDMDAIERRKDALLDDAFNWILDVPEFRVFTNDIDTHDDLSLPISQHSRLLWIKGPAGTGKTMLLLGIIRELSERPAALSPGIAHFFFQNADNTVNSSMAAVRSLVWMLLQQQPNLLHHLRDKYKNAQPSFVGRHAFVGLCSVLENMLQDPELEPVYFIVDALDECDDGLPELIDLIAHSLTITDKVNWLVSSRPTVPLGTRIEASALVELDSQRLEAPVHAYINHQLARLKNAHGYTDAIISDMAREITSRANNTYLWVWFVFQRLTKPNKNGKTLNGMYALRAIQQFPPGLSALYDHIMVAIERGEEDDPAYCKAALRAVYHAYRPLSLAELATFVDLPEDQTARIVDECGSFLTLTSTTVGLIHQSANDYLTENYTARLGTTSIAQGHADMGRLCLGAMSARLHKNMYDLPNIGPYDRATPPPSPDPLASVRYACIYWGDHFRDGAVPSWEKAGTSLLNSEAILPFLLKHFLHWLESLSLLQKIADGLASVRTLEDLLPREDTSDFAVFVRDALSFITWNSYCIELSPLQTYASALLFSPKNSKIRRNFEDQNELDWIKIKPAVQEDWDPYIQLNGHQHIVKTAAFSPDGKKIVSSGADHAVKIWDVASGMCTCTFLIHTQNLLEFVAFSVPDGKYVASSTGGGSISIWDVASEKCTSTLTYGHYGEGLELTSFAFCTVPGTYLACGFKNGAVKVWDVMSEEILLVFETHETAVMSLNFSLDGKHLITISGEGVEKTWEVMSGTCLRTGTQELAKLAKKTVSQALSNGNTLVAKWEDDIIRVWNTSSTHHTQPATDTTNSIASIAFSPDGTLVAAGSDDGTVTVWDAVSGDCVLKLKEHIELVTCVVFFPDGKQLASSSRDGTVKLWNLDSADCFRTLSDHQDIISSVAILQNGQLLVSLSMDAVVKIWDVATWTCTHSLVSCAMDLVFSPDERSILCISDNDGIEVIDVVSGECTHRVNDCKTLGMARTFSPDGTQIAFQTFDDGDIEVWDLTSHTRCQSLVGHEGMIFAIAFSPDGMSLASVTGTDALRVWDVSTGVCTRDSGLFEGANFATVFHPVKNDASKELREFDGLSWDGKWITKDGACLFWLPYEYRSELVYAVRGENIAIGVKPGQIWVLGL